MSESIGDEKNYSASDALFGDQPREEKLYILAFAVERWHHASISTYYCYEKKDRLLARHEIAEVSAK